MPLPDTVRDVIDRIRKLVALARGGASEAEAELAMQRAHVLLARHNLKLDEVEQRVRPASTIDDGRTIHTDTERVHQWERPVRSHAARLYFCMYYQCRLFDRATHRSTGRVEHSLVGLPHNILVTRLMTDYLLKTVRRLAREASVGAPPDERASYAHSFRVACGRRLGERLVDRRHAGVDRPLDTEDGRSLPALRSIYERELEANRELLAAEGIELVDDPGPGARVTNILGEEDGKAAAETISLSTQIGSGAPAPDPGQPRLF